MIVAAAVLPHCPALIPEIAKGEQSNIPKTIAKYKELVALFESKDIETIIVVSGQTVPYIDSFTVNTSKKLVGDFSFFDYKDNFGINNDISLGKKMTEMALKNNLKLIGMDTIMDYGQAIPLYFFKDKIKSALVLNISMDSLITHKMLGELVAVITQDITENIGLIISTDLSNKVSKESKEYDKEAQKWNYELLDILNNDISKISRLDPFITDDVAGEYPVRAVSVLEGVFSRYLYKPYSSEYEEAFGVGYGTVLYDLL